MTACRGFTPGGINARRVTKTVTSTKLGRSGIRMPSSYPAPPAPVPPGVTMATPPGASAPEFDRGLSSFFVWQVLLFAPGPIKIQWRPVFVWLFLPLFFNPGGLLGGDFPADTGDSWLLVLVRNNSRNRY